MNVERAVTMFWWGQSAGKILGERNHIMEKDTWLNKFPNHIGHYIAGFVDGEGIFNVSLRKRTDHTMQWQVVLTFNVSQKDRVILALLKKHIGCGRLQTRADGVSYYVVSNPTSIIERVIPFFQKFPFLSQTKKMNFSIFRKISRMVYEKQHLNPEGLEEIIRLREKLNKGRGRKRKYSIQDYTKSNQENPQRLHARPRKFRKEIQRG